MGYQIFQGMGFRSLSSAKQQTCLALRVKKIRVTQIKINFHVAVISIREQQVSFGAQAAAQVSKISRSPLPVIIDPGSLRLTTKSVIGFCNNAFIYS